MRSLNRKHMADVSGCIRTLIGNGVKSKHRSLFVISGDNIKEKIVKLHTIVGDTSTVLWCSKDKLSLRGKKRRSSFNKFLKSIVLTECLYKDSQRVLGNTFGMCILQDFEALTPVLLQRTIDTVVGRGLIILLLPSSSPLEDLEAMAMDVHKRFCTESRTHATWLFNLRFRSSIACSKACVAMDDKWSISTISSHIKSIAPVAVPDKEGCEGLLDDINSLMNEHHENVFVAPLVKNCCTLDQIEDLIHVFSHLYFQGRIPVTLSLNQASVLLCAGLQRRDISHIENDMTGEHTCMVLKHIQAVNIQWGCVYQDFKQRFSRLLSSSFCSMDYNLAMSVLDPTINFAKSEAAKSNIDKVLEEHISFLDLKRLQFYVNNSADFPQIEDLVHVFSHLYFQGRIPVTLSLNQASVLLCAGLQRRDISHIERQLDLDGKQILSLLIEAMNFFSEYLSGNATKESESTFLKEVTRWSICHETRMVSDEVVDRDLFIDEFAD